MKISFKWNKPAAQVAKEATGGDKTLLFMASEAKRLMFPYVPFFNKQLSTNVRTYVEKKQGIVEYMEPYASNFTVRSCYPPKQAAPGHDTARRKRSQTETFTIAPSATLLRHQDGTRRCWQLTVTT